MKNAVSGLGLAPDASMVTFPIDMFLPGSDLSTLELRKREFYNGLTKWRSDFEQGSGESLDDQAGPQVLGDGVTDHLAGM